MKVKLEYEDKEHGSVVEMNTAPRVGERLMTASGETMEIIQVVHTPTSEECGDCGAEKGAGGWLCKLTMATRETCICAGVL